MQILIQPVTDKARKELSQQLTVTKSTIILIRRSRGSECCWRKAVGVCPLWDQHGCAADLRRHNRLHWPLVTGCASHAANRSGSV